MTYILLVEDDALSRMVVEDILEYEDIPASLVCSESGEDALERAAELRPILILMDIMLPGIDGLETTRQLKQDPRTEDIPVWAMSARLLKTDGVEAIEAGCATFLSKPIEGELFAIQLREFMRELSPPLERHVVGDDD